MLLYAPQWSSWSLRNSNLPQCSLFFIVHRNSHACSSEHCGKLLFAKTPNWRFKSFPKGGLFRSCCYYYCNVGVCDNSFTLECWLLIIVHAKSHASSNVHLGVSLLSCIRLLHVASCGVVHMASCGRRAFVSSIELHGVGKQMHDGRNSPQHTYHRYGTSTSRVDSIAPPV
jgi:hypothetical protein